MNSSAINHADSADFVVSYHASNWLGRSSFTASQTIPTGDDLLPSVPVTSFRIISGLQWAQRTSPHAGQAARPGSPKAAGLLLEPQIANSLPPSAIRGQWFKFRDIHGVGYCQPDFILHRDNSILVLECKLTYHTYAFQQLHHLYVPVVSHVYQRPATGLLLTAKNWQQKLANIQLN